MISKQKLLANLKALPTLPVAATRIAELLGDDRSGMADYEKAIRPDAALTSNLLRIANSAMFRRSREITSVRHALSMLGEKRLYELVVTAGFARVLPSTLPGYNVEAKQFWMHNIAVAIMGENLSKVLGCDDQDMMFTAGLLHDMGKLAIGSFIDEHLALLKKAIQEDRLPFIDAERKVLGTDHTEIGEMVAKQWNLPEILWMAARYHHDPDACPKSEYQRMLDVIHAADALAFQLGFGNDFGELSRRVQPDVVDRLGLKIQQLENVASESLIQIDEMGELFETRA